jgi:hypothetical protein
MGDVWSATGTRAKNAVKAHAMTGQLMIAAEGRLLTKRRIIAVEKMRMSGNVKTPRNVAMENAATRLTAKRVIG